MVIPAVVLWPIGEVHERVHYPPPQTRIAGLTHSARLRRIEARCLVRTDAWRARALCGERARLARLAREHDLPIGARSRFFLEGWRPLDAVRQPRGSRTCGAAPMMRRTERSGMRRAHQDCAGRGRSPCGRTRTSGRDPRRRPGDLERTGIARSMRNCVGPAAKSCSNETPPIPRPRKRLS